MSDDFDFQGAGHVADEADVLHRAAGRDQRGGDGEERIAGSHRVDDALGEGWDRIWATPPCSSVTQPCLPWVMMIFGQSIRDEIKVWAMSPIADMRSDSASRASGASMHR